MAVWAARVLLMSRPRKSDMVFFFAAIKFVCIVADDSLRNSMVETN